MVKGDARDPRNLIEMGEGLVPDRYEYIKVRLDKDDPFDPTPAVGPLTSKRTSVCSVENP